MRRSARTAASLTTPVLLAALAACAAATTTTGTGIGTGTASGSTATSAVPVSSLTTTALSTTSAGTPSPPGATFTTSPAPGAIGTCLDHASVLYPGSDNPLRHTCVRVGGTLTITLTATGNYRWTTPTSSTPATATVGDVHTDLDGTLHATVTARAPGTTTLSAADSFTPDPHGPPSRLWTLTLTVKP